MGIALLFKTTGLAPGMLRFWPLFVLATGGVLLYLTIVRGFASPFFFGGLCFCLFGLLRILGYLWGWTFARAWPLLMVAAGISWFAAGLRHRRAIKAGYAVPALGFVALGGLFSVFSFDLVGVSFARFVTMWWPSLFIAGGVALFIAYGVSSHRRGHRRRPGRS